MNARILDTEVQAFLAEQLGTDPAKLAMQRSRFDGVRASELAAQLEARQKAKLKFPSWFATAGLYYPKRLNLEQSSSEATAQFKASLLTGCRNILDMTGGMGLDSWAFSQVAESVTYCELDEELGQITAHNLHTLGRKNIQCLPGQESISYLSSLAEGHFDACYLDPARRDGSSKVFLLKDCQPDILSIQEELLSRVGRILLKLSPMLDIKSALRVLIGVEQVFVVAAQGECKELLILLSGGDSSRLASGVAHSLNDIPISVVTLDAQGQESISRVTFTYAEEDSCSVEFSADGKYLYEPNPAILKSGGFNYLSKHFSLKKLHQHSHLYVADSPHEQFPGRVTEVEQVMSYGDFKRSKTKESANVVARNFPYSAAELRKKHQISEGQDVFLHFSTGPNDELLVIRSRRM